MACCRPSEAMQERSADKVASPPKTGRVEDGRIRKIRGASKPEMTAIQHFNGKTYACESCKRGHRVNKCDHGKTRPISETNQPGRPSAGQKRGCQCPRNCACTTKTCKCERDCSCTQEMYLVVRVDGPQPISREATSSPKPVWEDANGERMTLKRVWADANGKQIDVEEYIERKRRMKEREEGATSTPETVKSSCCGSKKVKDESSSPQPAPTGGCRHRQNVEKKPEIDSLTPNFAGQTVDHSTGSWKAACSCGSGCSCLYCPDHPNNATSINHTQQQVKNLAQQPYSEIDGMMPLSFMPDTNSRSCMGGQPSFFLSRTPDVSQQQLLDPNAIYLRYPISQHSWTNQPATAHCSHGASPSAVMSMTPDPNETYVEPLNEVVDGSMPWEFLPDESNGTWDFSGGQMGGTAFSWTDLDATHGTDYSIGEATVASVSHGNMFALPQGATAQQTPSIHVSMDPMLSPTHLNGLSIFDTNRKPGVINSRYDRSEEVITYTTQLRKIFTRYDWGVRRHPSKRGQAL
ncbi:hypothetical protein EDD37DRAFT_502934 [Exophiala viscosa]|uniref:uncharacterized protein n=1 Tax=Exophiala viscosa TaxID=2486360 RepID=UPI00219E494D|nr:hypothetical protein EDD37DRAFT_502934 [Exophiala viscosa]